MKLYDSHYDFQTGKCYSEEVGEIMTYEEKWEELRKWLCGLTINSPWCGGGGWDTAMLEVLVKMEEFDTGIEYLKADDCIRIAKKHGMF